MDNFWVKAVIFAAVIAAVVIGIHIYKGINLKQGAPPERTVRDVWQEDDQRLRAEPRATSSGEPNAANTASGEPKMQFRKLEVEEQAGAEQLFELAIAQRKMARLPAIRYGQMVDYCRQIIEKYPGSEFDYKARRMLTEVPRGQWDRYHITIEEINGFQNSTE